mmetsp:Transcript_23906/g.68397  ORF Transcript_23906/g.68397 Transcript_23906/m.68397 type:complete len:222 (+) Transcript_23906:53-718(+)
MSTAAAGTLADPLVAGGDDQQRAASKYKTEVPVPPTGSVALFQVVQTLLGLALAALLEWAGAEEWLRGVFKLDGSQRSLGVAMAIVALVSQFVMLPAMHLLVKSRQEQKVGQPIHHPAPNELGSEDDRLLWLYRLRAYENIVEWLPVFVSHAFAACVLGKVAVTVALCIPYTCGKLMYTGGYGGGSSPNRIPGLIVSDFLALLVIRGILIIEVCRHIGGSE